MRRLIVPILLAAVPDASAQQAPVTPGEGFEVERYVVSLRPDLATTAVSGTEMIRARSTSERLTRLTFTANVLGIEDATVDGVSVPVSSNQNGIIFTLPRPRRIGERMTLRFRFRGTPARGLTAVAGGLYASYFACDWMVCLQDTPGDKAQLTLDLLLPAGMTSVGVGRAGSQASVGGLVRHRWRSTRPYSSYLYAFAAGPFARRVLRAGEGEFTYLDATGANADLVQLFDQTSAIAAFFADKAGLDLPDRRYAQLLVPGREAQETASFSLIGKAELDRDRGEPASAWVVAHELAHQWWGNLVTCASWREFWLNEGIATFMVAAWKQQSVGDAAYAQELDVARRRLERVRAIGFDKPLAWNGSYPSLSARRAVQYSKGALFLAELRGALGDTAFWAGLRRYTRRHAGGTVTSRDFQNAMEEASGRDFSPLFARWVYGEGAD